MCRVEREESGERGKRERGERGEGAGTGTRRPALSLMRADQHLIGASHRAPHPNHPNNHVGPAGVRRARGRRGRFLFASVPTPQQFCSSRPRPCAHPPETTHTKQQDLVDLNLGAPPADPLGLGRDPAPAAPAPAAAPLGVAPLAPAPATTAPAAPVAVAPAVVETSSAWDAFATGAAAPVAATAAPVVAPAPAAPPPAPLAAATPIAAPAPPPPAPPPPATATAAPLLVVQVGDPIRRDGGGGGAAGGLLALAAGAGAGAGGGSGGQHVEYLVTTATSAPGGLPGWRAPTVSVRRRFRDAVALADLLKQTHRGYFVPPRCVLLCPRIAACVLTRHTRRPSLGRPEKNNTTPTPHPNNRPLPKTPQPKQTNTGPTRTRPKEACARPTPSSKSAALCSSDGSIAWRHTLQSPLQTPSASFSRQKAASPPATTGALCNPLRKHPCSRARRAPRSSCLVESRARSIRCRPLSRRRGRWTC
jgi:hypothetical protein